MNDNVQLPTAEDEIAMAHALLDQMHVARNHEFEGKTLVLTLSGRIIECLVQVMLRYQKTQGVDGA